MKNIKVYENTDGNFTLEGDNIFKKVVAKVGRYISSNGKAVTLTKELFQELIDTFKGNVPIPRGHKGFYDPLMNTGWVKGLSLDGDNLVADMEFTDKEVTQKVKDKTIKDVSIGVIKDNGKKVLEHIAITLNPAISDLGDFVSVAPEGVKLEKYEFEGCEKKEEIMADEVKEVVTEAVSEPVKEELETVSKEKEEFEAAKVKVLELEKLLADRDALIKQAEDKAKAELAEKAKTIETYKTNAVVMELEKFVADGKLAPANKELAKSLLMFEGKIELEKDGAKESLDVADAIRTFISNTKVVDMDVHTAPKGKVELEKTQNEIVLSITDYEKKSDKERAEVLAKVKKGEIKLEGVSKVK